MRLSNSKVKTWRRCPNQYKYKYVMGLRPKERKVQLETGTWIHDLLEHHYRGDNWKKRHKELTKQFYNLFEEEREMLGDVPGTCYLIMKNYVRRYAQEDRQYRVIDTELNEIVTLPSGIELNVVVDLIMEDKRGRLWPWDHKSSAGWKSSDDMLLDPQLSLYFEALKILGYKKLGGAVYNEIRTKPPRVPPLVDVNRNPRLSKKMDIDTDVYTYMREIRRHGFDPNDYTDILQHLARNQKDKFFRRTVLPKDRPMLRTMTAELAMTAREIQSAEARAEFPRTFIPRQCKWDCSYKELCIAELHGSNIETMIKAGFTRSRHLKRGEELPEVKLK